jgi:parallel beta-helix repeat protein
MGGEEAAGRAFRSLFLAVLTGLLPSAGAAQNAVAVVSASAYGNFHAGGVVLTVSGDANGNATAALEWRGSGGSFLTAQPLERVDSAHFVGSLFGLAPATSYEARVSLADPDGVAGSPVTAAFSTRVDTLAEPTLRTLYVSPGGDDANAGTSPGAPVRTIQRAANLAQAGDLVLIEPGVYRESVSVPRSGTAAQPIVFRGNGAGVVLDGADAAIAAGVPWAPAAGGTWSRVTGFATGHVVTEKGRLFRYTSLAALQALAAGAPGGFYFDGTTLYLKLADASSPASHAVQVARLEDGFVVDGRAFVRIEGLEIRYYGAGDYGKGVYLRYSSDCTVRSCRIHEVGSAGVWVKGGEENLVEDNLIWDTSIFGWPWGQTKGSSSENNAIAFSDDVGRGNVVRRNTVYGQFNGIAPCGSLAPPSGVTNETDVYENVLSKHTDDAFEPEGYCSNVRLWGNRIQDVHMAFAVAPAAAGPVYILRNVAWRIGNTRTSLQDGYTASALKINSGYPTPIGPLLVYHNTFLTDVPATEAIALLNPGESTLIRARNNVVAGTRYALYKVNPVVWNGDGDDLYTTDSSRLVSWMGTRYDTLPDFQALGQEPHGLSAPPQLASPAGGSFAPQPGSPLIDAGLLLPGIDDSYLGAAPDVGAIEWPGPPAALAYYTVTPCRAVDTRNPALGGPSPLAAGADGVFPLAGLCGIPITAKAVSLNLAVTQPTAAGNVRLYPAGTPLPLVSTINYAAGQTRANNAVVSLDDLGRVAARCSQASGSVHVILDLNGYFE